MTTCKGWVVGVAGYVFIFDAMNLIKKRLNVHCIILSDDKTDETG